MLLLGYFVKLIWKFGISDCDFLDSEDINICFLQYYVIFIRHCNSNTLLVEKIPVVM